MRIPFVVIAFFLIPATARAQSSNVPASEIRTAAGLSNFLHGDIAGIAPSVRVALRIGMGRFAIEPLGKDQSPIEIPIARAVLTTSKSFGTVRCRPTTFSNGTATMSGGWNATM